MYDSSTGGLYGMGTFASLHCLPWFTDWCAVPGRQNSRSQACLCATLRPLPGPAALLCVLTTGLLTGCRPGAGGSGQPDNHAA